MSKQRTTKRPASQKTVAKSSDKKSSRKKGVQRVENVAATGSPDDLLTPVAAAQLIGYDPATVYRWLVRHEEYAVLPVMGEGEQQRRYVRRGDLRSLVRVASRGGG